MGDEVDQEWQTVKGRNRIDNKGMKQKIDIATAKGFKGDGSVSLTTFFFTDFPTSFGAKAMFNAFHYYGDILEVVIPAKRDRRGRRFGFARFKNVMDAQGFESELANLTIGRDKISVNLSRYHRHEGSRVDRKEGQKKRDDQHREGGRKGEGHRPFHKTVQPLNLKEPKSSYAQVVRKTKCEKQGEEFHRICLSYEADKEDLKRYQKAFIGKVAQSGMTYNIQEAFHREGYFGVKVTPLGSNLTLLEGQDEGEVEALMEDAKDWLDQWFSSIRPWSPNDIDTERSIWLRIYGIPIHAWNLNFFTQVVKPWGTFINADEGTTKKITMDVARIMIRTTCQLVVDEFTDVKINGKIFHLRILEDSYGPMRILIPQNKNSNGRDNATESDEEEDEDEEERCLIMEEEELEPEREREGEQNDLGALTPVVNAINGNNNPSISVMERVNMASNCSDSNSNSFNSGGVVCKEKGINEEDSKIVEEEFCLGQEVGLGGPQNPSNTILSITGGVISSRHGLPDVDGPILSINSQNVTKAITGDMRKQEGGVYSDGPSIVYNKLTQEGPNNTTMSCPIPQTQVTGDNVKKHIHPLPANVRRQNHLIHKLNLGKPVHSVSTAVLGAVTHRSGAPSSRSSSEQVGMTRNLPTGNRRRSKPENSLSSAGTILCCSPIGSTEIRNCNSRFLTNHEIVTANKVWKGAAELGVVGEEVDAQYVERIRINEKKEEEARRLRKQQNQGIP
jgi:hypothetical protein